MKDDESIPEMFYRLQVIINDLKGLGEKVKDEDFIHKFLMCLPKRFKTLRTIIFRGGLTGVSPNEVLGDVMTEDQYNDNDDDEVMKKDDDDKKKKSVAFKASSLSKSKNKGKAPPALHACSPLRHRFPANHDSAPGEVALACLSRTPTPPCRTTGIWIRIGSQCRRRRGRLGLTRRRCGAGGQC